MEATVWYSKASLRPKSMKPSFFMRMMRRMALSESPPTSQKLLVMPRSVTPSTSSQIAVMRFSSSVTGRTTAASRFPASITTSGSRFLSSLPLGVHGISPSSSKWAGIMYSGSRLARWSRRAATGTSEPV